MRERKKYFFYPELNNAQRFLRGGSASETAEYTYQEDALQQHAHDYIDRYKDDATNFDIQRDRK
jgi:hypothetical protein